MRIKHDPVLHAHRADFIWGLGMIKKIINNAIGHFGYEIKKVSSCRAHDLRRNEYSPTPLEGMYWSEVEKYIVDVPTELIASTNLMDVWISTLKIYATQGEGAARDCLAAFFSNYQPKTVAEFLNIAPSQPWHHGHPLSYVYPWEATAPEGKMRFRVDLMRKEAQEGGFLTWQESDGWKGFGPASRGMVELELRRLLSTFESIRSNGFDERHGYVVSRIYSSGEVQLIQPRIGWHRVATCLALGMNSMPMMFDRKHAVIRLEDAGIWPNVRRHYFSRAEAIEIFERRFSAHLLNRYRARELSLESSGDSR